MDITDDRDGCIDVHDVGFAHKDFLCLFAYFAEEGLVEELFSEELVDASVEIKRSHCGE
jgi:hypothetical protein